MDKTGDKVQVAEVKYLRKVFNTKRSDKKGNKHIREGLKVQSFERNNRREKTEMGKTFNQNGWREAS